ncbi:MAG TPA: SMP-30/gluconolactonase/LRE family protein [Flavitalea sp.]|nr:SMP-30/gluconolactonase/LRE family protein [Flavitalea sp.]
MSLIPELVCDTISVLGEGPVWDDELNSITWIDILNGRIHQRIGQAPTTTMEVGRMIGAAAPISGNRWIAALQDGFAFVDLNTRSVTPIHDPEAHLPENRFNDGKCDEAGRFWAGTMAIQEDPGCGSLYVIDQSLHARKVLDDVDLSNGLAWSSDNRNFFHIDSPVRQVSVYPFDIEHGTLGERTHIFKIPEADGYPDGACIDNEDMLWIAHYDGWQVCRWNPLTGQKLLTIKLPVSQVTCCTFGGPGLDDLYITTARQKMTEDQLKDQPMAGSLFVVRNCGFRGRKTARFRE